MGEKGVAIMLMLAFAANILVSEPPAPPPPGRMLDLGGRRLHLVAAGADSPAVIFENGGGGVSVEWALVQAEVSKFAQTIAYDRAGYAWSDRGPTYDGIEQTADDLHLLLRLTRIRPPYILVSASLGAIHVRAFQRRYPDEVAGIVFVDGTHDEAVTFMLKDVRRPISTLSADELRAAYLDFKKNAPKPTLGPMDQPPLNRLSPEFQQARHWSLAKLVAEIGLLPHGLEAAESWRQEFTTLRRQRLGSPHPLGDLPLIVLERTKERDEVWHRQQAELANLSRAGIRREVEGSGHLIHLDHPEAVVAAIREVHIAAKRRRPQS